MQIIDQQVTRTRRRMLLALWLDSAGRSLTWAVALLAVWVLASRILGWPIWFVPIASAWVVFALLVATVQSFARRPSRAAAAARLDAAANLRERVSSSLLCGAEDDPFNAAVRADAEQRVTALRVTRQMPLRWPGSFNRAGVACVVLGLSFLVPAGLLTAAVEEPASALRRQQIERTRAEVKKPLERIKKLARENAAVAELNLDLEQMAPQPAQKMERPEDIRREAVKKIDKLADAVRERQTSEQFDKLAETKRMFRALKPPEGKNDAVQKLTKQLASGDFKTARETINELKEQLATLESASDEEFKKKMEKQLGQLAKQLDQLAKQDQLRKKLEQAGIKKEDAERMLQQLTKEDLSQLREQLQKQGLSQRKIDQLARQIQQQQGAAQACQTMSQAMSNAAKSAGDGDMGGAGGSLSQADEQLSELEMMQQEMNQLDSALDELKDARGQAGNCDSGGGDGEGEGEGEGEGQGFGRGKGKGGTGGLGKGRGGLNPSEETAVNFKRHRGKVETTEGKIVGQFLVEGEQVKGEARDTFVELIAAGTRDATDAITRDRIPRQYQKAVREYFARLPKEFGVELPPDALPAEGDPDAGGGAADSDGTGADEPAAGAKEDAPASDAGGDG